MHVNSTGQRLWAGALLGALFGVGLAMGIAGGWSLIDTAALPLQAAERLSWIQGMVIFIGIGAVFGVVWGFICGLALFLGTRNTLIVAGLIGVATIVELAIGSFPVLPLIFGLPTLIGYSILQLYLWRKRPLWLLPLVVGAGFMFAHIPWMMNGKDTERAAHRTQAYAERHAISNYEIAITQAESGGYRTQIHLADGAILYCYAWPAENEFKECTPTPQ